MEIQYKAGDYVKYGVNGVCLVKDIQELSFTGGAASKYYVLSTNTNSSTVIYVPVGNENLTSKMRRILTKEQIDATLTEVDSHEIEWIENRKERIERFQTILNNGDTVDLLRLIACIYKHKQSVIKQGKKFSLTDEGFMQQAESIIENEFSFVLDIEPHRVKDYIQNKIK